MNSDCEHKRVFAAAVQEALAIVRAELARGEAKIHQLVQTVAGQLSFPWSGDSYVAMYQKLFVTQAALCELYFAGEEQGDFRVYLNSLCVRLVPLASPDLSANAEMQSEFQTEKQAVMSGEADWVSPNTAFFCDWQNFVAVDASRVQDLLQNFWCDYSRFVTQDQALRSLNLSPSARWPEIQRRFRLLAAQYHPDKGGDVAAFIEIRAAYESLKKVRRNH